MPPVLLNGQELAKELGEKYAVVMEWARDGIIPSIRSEGRVYFNLAKVIRAIRARQQVEQAEAVSA